MSRKAVNLLLTVGLLVGLSAGMLSPPTMAAGQEASPSHRLVAVIPADFPPTYFRDPDSGKPSGLAVEVMDELARMTGLELEYRFGEPWDEIESLLLSGQADLIPFRVINEKTQTRFIFTQTLDASPVNDIVRRSDNPSPGQPSETRVGVIQGSTADERLKGQQNIIRVPRGSLQELLMDLLTGHVDRLLTPSENLVQLAEQAGLQDRVRVITPPVFEIVRAIALRPGSEALRDVLDQALISFEGSPRQKEIYERWLGKREPWWTVRRVLAVSGGCFAFLLVGVVGWRFVGMHRLNQRLSAEQAFLQTMIDAIPEPIFYKNREGVYQGCNAFFAEKFLGLSKKQIIGRTDFDLLPERSFAEFFRKKDQEALAAGEPRRNDEWVTLVDGRTILVETIKIPFRDASVDMAGIIGIARDITMRNQAHTLQSEARRRLQTILDNLPMMAWLKDTEGHFEVVNEAFASACGRRIDDVIGESDRSVWPFELTERHRFDDDEVIRSRGKKRSEELIEVQSEPRWFRFFRTPIQDQRGEVVGTAGIAEDITEQKRGEAERALLATAVQHAEENVIITDAHRTILYINPALERSSGYRLEDLKGKRLRDLRSDQHDDAFYRKMKETLDRGENWSGIIVSKGKHGKDFEVEGTISPIRDGSGAITHLVGAGRNLSHFRKLERELFQAQKMESVGRLAGGVAHDFNNMLGVIIGHAELAMDGIDASQPTYSDLQEILKASKRSASLVRQLLAFARKQVISPQVLDINTTVDSLLKMLKRLIGENIELIWHPSEDLWPVKVDPTQIDQILANLCVNARDAIAEVGQVVIKTGNETLEDAYCEEHPKASPGEYVRLTVSDTGCGMESEIMDRLFEPFFTTKDVGKGTGLGLATVYGIVKQNGGFIEVTSEPGQGTTFSIFLPRIELPTLEKQPPKPQETKLRGTETILLVEDEEAILELGKRTLDRYGYQVLAARNPMEALDLMDHYPGHIDLLITDVIMPGMNGKELAQRLSVFKAGFKSIYMSGYTDDVIAQHGMLEDGVHFLQKPFSVQSLAVRVREVLEA